MKYKRTLFIFILTLPFLASCGGGNKPNLYTVTFNPNGGLFINGASSIQVTSGTEFGQCSSPMIRQIGKVFKDWTFDIEGTNKVEPTFKINQNITFYAHLVDEYHTITFNANGGHFVGSPQTTFTVKEGTKLSTIDIPEATNNNSAYVGWANDEDGDNSVTKDYQIESDITLYAQYSNTALEVDDPEDNEILCYGSTAIGYHLYDLDQTVTASSSKTNVLNVSIDSAHSAVIVDAVNEDVEDSATITIGEKTCNIQVRHPESVQEAGECFDYALGRNVYDITLTFDYYNQEELEDFFNYRIETRLIAPYVYGDSIWSKGTSQTNRVHLGPDSKMATKSSDIKTEHSEYYYENLKNAAYELRHSKIQKRTDGHFAIDDAKKRLVVHNSETLFFALERGFRPEFVDSEIAVGGSLANRAYYVYQEARNACAEAFGTETTDNLMKVRQLFEYLVGKTHYDHWIVSDDFTADEFWQWSSYFSEGVFLNNGIAVCDGFSKALAIMGGIEGLPIIRSAGFANVGGHAWNYYQHNGRWYLICPTWAHDDNDAADSQIFNYNYSVMSYQPFMAESSYFYDHIYETAFYLYYYESPDHPGDPIYAKAYAELMAADYDFDEVLFSDITKSNAPYVSDIYTTDKFDGVHDYHLDTNSEADALVNAIRGLNLRNDFSVDISYFNGCGNVTQYFIDKLATLPNVKAVDYLIEYSLSHTEILVKF